MEEEEEETGEAREGEGLLEAARYEQMKRGLGLGVEVIGTSRYL